MIEWIINQQAPLTLAIAFLMTWEHVFSRKVDEALTYKLWLLIPVTILMNNMPSRLPVSTSDSFTRYVVGVKAEVDPANVNILLLLWAAGAILLGGILLAQHLRLSRSVSAQTGLYANVYDSTLATTPMLFGFISPKILIPSNFTHLFSPRQQQLILEHERTHLRHKDHVWNGIAVILTVLFWFNPFLWLGLGSFRNCQELACDRYVLRKKTRNEKLLYAKALVLCAEHSSTHPTLYPTFKEKKMMKKRLNAIKSPAPAGKLFGSLAVIAAATLTVNTALASLPTKKAAVQKVDMSTPILRVDPIYPVSAAGKQQEGSVVMQFDITKTGTVDNINVIKSDPEGVFDDSAVEALKQWQYKPRVQGGVAQRQKGLLVQLDFRLDSQIEDDRSVSMKVEKIVVPRH